MWMVDGWESVQIMSRFGKLEMGLIPNKDQPIEPQKTPQRV